MRYRLDVVAHEVADVVESAGGWIFDRAVAGWEVTVLVPGVGTDCRALRILGAQVVDLESVMAARGQGRRPDTVAISAAVCDKDARANRGLLKALHDGGVEVVVWGDSWISPPQHRVEPVAHHLSVAAQAFKVQALTAISAAPSPSAPIEVFRTGQSLFPPMGADLVPAG
ncbi:hypothetical protein [Nocardia bovistercoris]|uniref:Uncharacterized protein n=1 Tax=Nocardia bovistercoris TaxID=2785916 RepID=A0A931IDL0_9NOCA|nr:hypothetical protein [Nocardia bovistercoris]MBH0777880.1 hypothetical protein [Nocardia bovistercoris]